MFGERLKELRNLSGKTQQQIAEKSGVSRAAYSHFENERNEPDGNTLVKLSEIFEVSTDYLLGNSDQKTFISNELKVSGTIPEGNEIPILGRIVASNPEGAAEDYERDIAIQDSIIDKYGIENLFALRVNGDSMNKLIIPGSVAVIHKTDEWNDGDICAVLINGDEATLKRVYKKPHSICFEPDSWNPMQKPWEYSEDMEIYVSILGVYIYSITGI